jgi:hypothetical protein
MLSGRAPIPLVRASFGTDVADEYSKMLDVIKEKRLNEQTDSYNERVSMNSIDYDKRTDVSERYRELPRTRSPSYYPVGNAAERSQAIRTRSPSYYPDSYRHLDERYVASRTDHVTERSQAIRTRSPSYYRDDRNHRHLDERYQSTRTERSQAIRTRSPSYNHDDRSHRRSMHAHNQNDHHYQTHTNVQHTQSHQSTTLQYAQALAYLQHSDNLQNLTRGPIGGNYYR